MDNKEMLEAVCKEFNDNYMEDKWDDIPDNSITKEMTRQAMAKALMKLWRLRPAAQQHEYSEKKD